MSCYCQRHGVSDLPSSTASLPIEPEDDLWVIFGSRNFESEEGSTSDKAEWVLEQFDERGLATPDAIISGGADGADAVAEAVALKLGVPMIVFAVGYVDDGTSFRRSLADQPWVVEVVTEYEGGSDDPTSGRGAYMTRNCAMAEVVAQHGGRGFAIWDGDSPGTQAMLDSCDSHGFDAVVWKYTA
jgi:hypothetical protein